AIFLTSVGTLSCPRRFKKLGVLCADSQGGLKARAMPESFINPSSAVSIIGRSVLIVEDEMIIAYCIADQLEDLQFSVQGIEASGEEALKTAAAKKPDIAIVDVGLRGRLDGVETAIELRRRFDVPSILASGAGGKALAERVKEARPIAIL